MSESFIAAFLIALLIVVFWRIALPILLAILIALLVTGVGAVARVVGGGDDGRTQVVAPADPALGGQAGSEPPPR
jgi:hypothetical protein